MVGEWKFIGHNAWPKRSPFHYIQRYHLAIHLARLWTRLWVVHTRQLDFESVVLLLPMTPLNQALVHSVGLPHITLSPGLSITTSWSHSHYFFLFTKIHHHHWIHSPFLNNPWVCYSVPCTVSLLVLIKGSIFGPSVKVQKSDQTGDWTQDLLDIYQML